LRKPCGTWSRRPSISFFLLVLPPDPDAPPRSSELALALAGGCELETAGGEAWGGEAWGGEAWGGEAWGGEAWAVGAGGAGYALRDVSAGAGV